MESEPSFVNNRPPIDSYNIFQLKMNAIHLYIGTILQGSSYNYRIQKVLGQGSFGITYLASIEIKGSLGTINSNTVVAIKEFFMKDINGREKTVVTCGSKGGLYEDYKRKFIREAKNLSKLDHPNIVKVLESFETNNTAYYVMEYIDGGNLNEYIEQHNGLSEAESLKYFKEIASALSYMHSHKMLHLDMKPSNVMLRKNGEIVLIDFGLSKQYDENGTPESSTTVGGGTPGYAPIEQSNYHEGKDFPVTMDVYALGATLFKMLTGVRPPEASTIFNEGFPYDLLKSKNVSSSIVDIISRAMSSAKRTRFQSINQMVIDIDNVVNISDKKYISLEDVISEDTEYSEGFDTSSEILQDTKGVQQKSIFKTRQISKCVFVVIICIICLLIFWWVKGVGPDLLPDSNELTATTNVETIDNEETIVLPGKLYKDYSKIEIGDYFYSDGSFSRGVIDSLKPVGVVFSLEVSENDRKRGWTHGYIMALTDAKRGRCKWGPIHDIKEITNYSDSEDEMRSMMKDLNGYDYTYCSTLESTKNDAFYYAKNYDASLPQNTSGWFLPSFGHWVYLVENLGKTDVYTKVINQNNGLTYIYFNSSEALKNLGKYGFKDDDYSIYWSSCEGPKFEGWKQDAWIIWFNNNPNNYIYSLVKETSRMSIRTVAAF